MTARTFRSFQLFAAALYSFGINVQLWIQCSICMQAYTGVKLSKSVLQPENKDVILLQPSLPVTAAVAYADRLDNLKNKMSVRTALFTKGLQMPISGDS